MWGKNEDSRPDQLYLIQRMCRKMTFIMFHPSSAPVPCKKHLFWCYVQCKSYTQPCHLETSWKQLDLCFILRLYRMKRPTHKMLPLWNCMMERCKVGREKIEILNSRDKKYGREWDTSKLTMFLCPIFHVCFFNLSSSLYVALSKARSKDYLLYCTVCTECFLWLSCGT